MLHIVATPIGNLKDITLRALEVLKNTDFILCEDTRHAKILLNHHGIDKPLIAYYKQKEREQTQKVLSLLKDNKDICLITDAGTPCISDPGSILVSEAHKNGYKCDVLPGASAVVSAYALSGNLTNGFCFVGFLPEKTGEKEDLLLKFKNTPVPLIFYSAPHDLKKHIAVINKVLGERDLCVVKEITKVHETVYFGTTASINIENEKGEFVLIVGESKESEKKPIETIETRIKELKANGMKPNDVAKIAAFEYGITKNEAYKLVVGA